MKVQRDNILLNNTYILNITRAHSFPRAAEFRAKLQNLPFGTEFQHCRGIWEMTNN